MPESSERFPNHLPPRWKALLSPEKEKDYFRELSHFLNEEHRNGETIYPPKPLIFRALQSVDYDQVKVVILGQDPYHGASQALGLCFGVPEELRPKPPSLMNIYKEISSDLGLDMTRAGSELTGWAAQGVLLLNTVLTVRASQAFSHRDKGWEHFTDRIIELLNERKSPMIFLLWGAAAQKKKALLTNSIHRILEAPHPSPLSASRGFFGCRHFSKANELLRELGHEPIQWHVTTKS